MRASFARVAHHAQTSQAPPEAESERFWYGVAQPFLGLRVLWQQPLLRKRAIVPALLVLAVAAVTVMSKRDPAPHHVLVRYYAAVAGLASLPSVLLANTYERLAADAANVLGFGEATPLLSRFSSRIVRMVQAAILVTLGAAPVLFILGSVPFTGSAVAFVASGAWSVHWIVVEALDGARMVQPHEGEPHLPWFAAWTAFPIWESTPAFCRRIVQKFGNVLTRLSKPWNEEIALVVRHPWLALGFGLATAVLLAVPIANLFLRSAVLVGAVHLRGHLAEREAPTPLLQAPESVSASCAGEHTPLV